MPHLAFWCPPSESVTYPDIGSAIYFASQICWPPWAFEPSLYPVCIAVNGMGSEARSLEFESLIHFVLVWDHVNTTLSTLPLFLHFHICRMGIIIVPLKATHTRYLKQHSKPSVSINGYYNNYHSGMLYVKMMRSNTI